MMSSMPKGLTASTGMDALTHAIEGYTTLGAWEMSDMFHLEAINLFQSIFVALLKTSRKTERVWHSLSTLQVWDSQM